MQAQRRVRIDWPHLQNLWTLEYLEKKGIKENSNSGQIHEHRAFPLLSESPAMAELAEECACITQATSFALPYIASILSHCRVMNDLALGGSPDKKQTREYYL